MNLQFTRISQRSGCAQHCHRQRKVADVWAVVGFLIPWSKVRILPVALVLLLLLAGCESSRPRLSSPG